MSQITDQHVAGLELTFDHSKGVDTPGDMSEEDQTYTMFAENIEALTPAEQRVPIPMAATTPIIRSKGGKPLKNVATP